MICNHTGDALPVVAAALIVGLTAATLPLSAGRTLETAEAAALRSEYVGQLPTAAVVPATAREAAPGVRLGGGGCGEREIRVFDAAAGEYRTRIASVCWRNIL
jgi:hypothetical protein